MKYHKLPPTADDPGRAINSDPRNSRKLAAMWDAFIDAKQRMEGEGPFLLRHLQKESGCRKVFDACGGTGVDSIFLLKNGYDVTSNELDPAFRAKAMANSRREKVSTTFTAYDWLKLDRDIKPNSFEAVICLGNSLTYLFQHSDQLRALSNFFSILKDGGILILDTRNYDYLLDERKAILKNGDFRYSGCYVYCGTGKVHAMPITISDDEVVMRYTRISTHWKGYLHLYPFRRTELYALIREAGFSPVTFFSDYQSGLNTDADFFQFVCRKSQAI